MILAAHQFSALHDFAPAHKSRNRPTHNPEATTRPPVITVSTCIPRSRPLGAFYMYTIKMQSCAAIAAIWAAGPQCAIMTMSDKVQRERPVRPAPTEQHPRKLSGTTDR